MSQTHDSYDMEILKQLKKISSSLASIDRRLAKDNDIEITVDTKELEYERSEKLSD